MMLLENSAPPGLRSGRGEVEGQPMGEGGGAQTCGRGGAAAEIWEEAFLNRRWVLLT